MNANVHSSYRRQARLLVLTCLSVTGISLLCGCSSFESRWKAAGATPNVTPRSLEGPWQGSWVSEASGHSGGLRCIIIRKDNELYTAEFKAAYGKIFTFGYSVNLEAKATEPGKYLFKGDSDLGWLAGGKYHYDGSAAVSDNVSTDSFSCAYKSASDHGTFNMTRPTSPATAQTAP